MKKIISIILVLFFVTTTASAANLYTIADDWGSTQTKESYPGEILDGGVDKP
jgi:hypothetical protein